MILYHIHNNCCKNKTSNFSNSCYVKNKQVSEKLQNHFAITSLQINHCYFCCIHQPKTFQKSMKAIQKRKSLPDIHQKFLF